MTGWMNCSAQFMHGMQASAWRALPNELHSNRLLLNRRHNELMRKAYRNNKHRKFQNMSKGILSNSTEERKFAKSENLFRSYVVRGHWLYV